MKYYPGMDKAAALKELADKGYDIGPLKMPRKREPKERPGLDFHYTSLEKQKGDDKVHRSVFPPGVSLELCEGEQEIKDQSDGLIEFSHDTHLTINTVKKLAPSDSVHDRPITLYHKHVLWSYILRTWQCKKDCYEFHMVSHGPHVTVNDDPVGIGANEPAGLSAPNILEATFAFIDKDGNEKQRFDLETAPGPRQLTVKKFFTRAELVTLAVGGSLIIRTRFVIARSYFSLNKILWKPPSVSRSTKECVQRILQHEMVPGCDWQIIIKSDSEDGNPPLSYYAHGAALSRVSKQFKNAIELGQSIKDRLYKLNDTNSLYIPVLLPQDMPVLFSIAYSTPMPLPDEERTYHLGVNLFSMINWNVMKDFVFRHWERSICEQALALDKRDLKSLPVIYRLINYVFCSPYGALPVAKRVTIGVFADMIYMSTPSGDLEQAFCKKEKFRGLPYNANYKNILRSAMEHAYSVTSVRKVALGSQKEKNTQSDTVLAAAAGDFDAPKQQDEKPVAVPIAAAGNSDAPKQEDEKPAVSPDLEAVTQGEEKPIIVPATSPCRLARDVDASELIEKTISELATTRDPGAPKQDEEKPTTVSAISPPCLARGVAVSEQPDEMPITVSAVARPLDDPMQDGEKPPTTVPATSPSRAARDLASPTVVNIEDEEGAEITVAEEPASIDQAEGAKWQCIIS